MHYNTDSSFTRFGRFLRGWRAVFCGHLERKNHWQTATSDCSHFRYQT
jgi:hypothetical protein